MTEAAYTQPSGEMPDYINARVENGHVVVRIRQMGIDNTMTMAPNDFAQWVADCQRIAAEAVSASAAFDAAFDAHPEAQQEHIEHGLAGEPGDRLPELELTKDMEEPEDGA